MTESPLTIRPYIADLEKLLDLFQMSMGLSSLDGVRQLIAVERARGTRYYTAQLDGQVVGLVGVYFDATGAASELEPPQIIDLAVAPAYRRKGVARALVNVASREVRAAGFTRLWLYTDGNSVRLLTFYRALGFRLEAVVPDWFGDGSVKAYFRMDFEQTDAA